MTMSENAVHDKLFIGGAWVEPATAETIEVVSPHTEQVIGRVPHASCADVDAAVAAARRAFDTGPWPRLSLAERIAVVTRIHDGLAARHQELAAVISAQNGSPIGWAVAAQALGPVAAFAAAIAVAGAFPFEEERRGSGGPLLVLREPVGVVAAVVPWNFPQFTTAAKLAPALLAGCTVILKPSPESPLDAYLLAEVCEAAGLPEGVLSVLPANREVSEYLVGHPGVDKVAFTGSVAAGKRIMEVAAQNLTRVTLELGGKSAGILLDDADLEVAVPSLVAAAYPNNGQTCVALTRILVPRSRYAEVARRFTDAVAALRVGDPADPATQIGPLVTRRQQQRSLDYIRVGLDEGATLLAGGGIPAGLETGWYVEPTLFGDVEPEMRIAQDEIFGPVVCLLSYEDDTDAARIANESTFGLAGTVWTADEERGVALARRIRTGTYAVNCQRLDLLGPFGGFKNSGVGRELGAEGLAAYTEAKTIALPRRR
jgi:acyl-CoA reductase-like NAD-dependent aldehyde dehydrogenase